MRKHRGLTDTTLDVYDGILAGPLDALGDDVRDYSAEALRAFVRFLGATGRCSAGMEHAIPGFASWQLTSFPRFLLPEEVERVIDSCSGYLFGIRDRAVLMLLARLGLRASEVAQLKFVDIDWRNGSITVCGKGRRQESLPLPQEVGNAILLYLNQGRPSLRAPEIFTSVLPPIRTLTRAGVTHIVRSALRRAGIKAPVNGAHVLNGRLSYPSVFLSFASNPVIAFGT